MSCFYIKQVRQRTKRFKQPSLWIGAFNHTHIHSNRVCVCVCVQEFLFVTSVQLKWDAVISSSRCICRTATTTNEAVCHLSPCRFFSDRSHIGSRFYLFVCSIKLSLCCTFMFLSWQVWGAVKNLSQCRIKPLFVSYCCATCLDMQSCCLTCLGASTVAQASRCQFLIIGCVHVLRGKRVNGRTRVPACWNQRILSLKMTQRQRIKYQSSWRQSAAGDSGLLLKGQNMDLIPVFPSSLTVRCSEPQEADWPGLIPALRSVAALGFFNLCSHAEEGDRVTASFTFTHSRTRSSWNFLFRSLKMLSY